MISRWPLLGLVVVTMSVVAASNAARLLAQAGGAASSAAFEVASVKPNKSGDARIMFGIQPGGRFTATNTTVQELIRAAYDIQFPGQLEGGPDWVRSERFDVLAKAPEGTAVTNRQNIAPLLRSLLTDRFKLAVRRENREMDTYDLVLARGDRKTGERLVPSTVDCAARGRGPARGASQTGPPQAPPAPGAPPSCGIFMGLGRVMAGGVTMAQVATLLSPRVSRIVNDKTGLAGSYQFELEFTPDQMPNIPAGGLPPGVELPPADGPSLFTALQEQLGLKLESSRGPVEVIVIQGIERPSED